LEVFEFLLAEFEKSTKPMAKSVTAVERSIQKMTATDVTGSES
jgi:hypothetical protein